MSPKCATLFNVDVLLYFILMHYFILLYPTSGMVENGKATITAITATTILDKAVLLLAVTQVNYTGMLRYLTFVPLLLDTA